MEKNSKIWIFFDDGQRVPAKVLGYNVASDIAMLKITKKGSWPSVVLADASPVMGSFCFTLAHPAGYMKERPAQVRLGRITSLRYRGKVPSFIEADVNIQPGDSGGPLYDMKGQLIGLDGSTGGVVGFNQFGTIDFFHLDRERMVNCEIFGDPALAPRSKTINTKITKENLKAVEKEFRRRVKIKHRYSVDYAADKFDKEGRLQLTTPQIIYGFGKDIVTLLNGRKAVLGMDDPDVMSRLPKLPKGAIKPVEIRINDKIVLLGMPVSPRLLLVKYSEYQNLRKSNIRLTPKGPLLKLVGQDVEWDLALLYCGDKAAFTPLDLTAELPQVAPGQGLLCLDTRGRTHWGVGMGPIYEIKEGGPTGRLLDKSLISKRRAPYKRALPHSLPLFAADACTPIYTFDGRFVGIHVARLNKTTGVIVTVNDLKMVVERMLN